MKNLPGNWPPGGSKEEDIDAYKCNASLLSLEIIDNNIALCILASGCCAQYRNNKLRDSHTDSSPEEKRASAPFVNCVKAGEGRGNVYATGNHTDDKGILNTRVLEKLCSVVENTGFY